MSTHQETEQPKDSLLTTILICLVVGGTLLAIIAGYMIWRGNESIRLLATPATQNMIIKTLSEQGEGIAVANLPPQMIPDATFSADISERPRIVAGWSEGTINDAAADIDAALIALDLPRLNCSEKESATLLCQIGPSDASVTITAAPGADPLATFIFPSRVR